MLFHRWQNENHSVPVISWRYFSLKKVPNTKWTWDLSCGVCRLCNWVKPKRVLWVLLSNINSKRGESENGGLKAGRRRPASSDLTNVNNYWNCRSVISSHSRLIIAARWKPAGTFKAETDPEQTFSHFSFLLTTISDLLFCYSRQYFSACGTAIYTYFIK